MCTEIKGENQPQPSSHERNHSKNATKDVHDAKKSDEISLQPVIFKLFICHSAKLHKMKIENLAWQDDNNLCLDLLMLNCERTKLP